MAAPRSFWERGCGRGIDPSEVAVGSKWGYIYTAGWQVDADKHEVKDHWRSSAAARGNGSHAGRALDLYQIHSATLESGVLDDAAVLHALAALKEEGIAPAFR